MYVDKFIFWCPGVRNWKNQALIVYDYIRIVL